MTNAPYLLPKARGGYRAWAIGEVMDHMFLDGLEDAYDKGRLMGTFAEDCAANYRFTREAQDALRDDVARRARRRRTTTAAFAWEIAPVTLSRPARATRVIDKRRAAAQGQLRQDSALKPAFRKDGTVTAANSSSISDGAAALVLMRRSDRARSAA